MPSKDKVDVPDCKYRVPNFKAKDIPLEGEQIMVQVWIQGVEVVEERLAALKTAENSACFSTVTSDACKAPDAHKTPVFEVRGLAQHEGESQSAFPSRPAVLTLAVPGLKLCSCLMKRSPPPSAPPLPP